jgi:sulfate/thiosulfate transport system permease protein
MAVARAKRVVPGFAPTLAYTVGYLCLLVLVPLFALPAKTATLDWSSFWNIVTDPRVVASYRLSLTTSLLAARLRTRFSDCSRRGCWCATAFPGGGYSTR